MDIDGQRTERPEDLHSQARPETVQSQKAGDVLETYHIDEHGVVLATGRA